MRALKSVLMLWRYNPITGYWVHERNVQAATAVEWLAVFRKGHANPEFFRVAKRRPTGRPEPLRGASTR